MEKLAESPLGDRLAARTEHLEALVARVSRDDVAAQTDGDVLGLDPTLTDDAHRLADAVEDLHSLVAPLGYGDISVEQTRHAERISQLADVRAYFLQVEQQGRFRDDVDQGALWRRDGGLAGDAGAEHHGTVVELLKVALDGLDPSDGRLLVTRQEGDH